MTDQAAQASAFASTPAESVASSANVVNTVATGTVADASNGIEGSPAVVASNGPGAEYTQYFAVVRQNPLDFSTWVHLLKSCESETYPVAKVAFDAFLEHYPFCYGYWNKYAELTKRQAAAWNLGPETVIAVYERGVAAVRLSVDIWGHYCNYMSSLLPDRTTPVAVREVLQRAVDAVGTLPTANTNRTNQLWNSLLNLELETTKDAKRVAAVYHQLLRSPFTGVGAFLVRYEEWAKSPAANLESPDGAVSDEDLALLQQELALPENYSSMSRQERIIHCVTVHHQRILAAEKARVSFETPLKDYFHVNPLTEAELNGWKSYLTFEKEQEKVAMASEAATAAARTRRLYERCVIRCANYPEFWLDYADYLNNTGASLEEIISIYNRCTRIHLKRQPTLKLAYADFLELKGMISEARAEYDNVRDAYPTLIQAALARTSFERRQGDIVAAEGALRAALQANASQLSTDSSKTNQDQASAAHVTENQPENSAETTGVSQAEQQATIGNETPADVTSKDTESAQNSTAFLAVQLANFHLHIKKDTAAARQIFAEHLPKCISSADFVAAYIAFEVTNGSATFRAGTGVDSIFAKILASDSGASPSLQASLWRRRVELIEDFGEGYSIADIVALRKQRDNFSQDASGSSGSSKRSQDNEAAGGASKRSRVDAQPAHSQQNPNAHVQQGYGQAQAQGHDAVAAQWAAYYAQQPAYGYGAGAAQGYGHQAYGSY